MNLLSESSTGLPRESTGGVEGQCQKLYFGHSYQHHDSNDRLLADLHPELPISFWVVETQRKNWNHATLPAHGAVHSLWLLSHWLEDACCIWDTNHECELLQTCKVVFYATPHRHPSTGYFFWDDTLHMHSHHCRQSHVHLVHRPKDIQIGIPSVVLLYSSSTYLML